MSTAALALLLLLRTYDTAGVPAHDLSQARRETAAILAGAGIDVSWTPCDGRNSGTRSRCGEATRPDELLIRIVTAPVNGRQARLGGDTLGDALVDTSAGTGLLATLYADRIAAMASGLGVARGALLGRAMAHEIGHLLLGTTLHEPQGLMRAQWSASMIRRSGSEWAFSLSDAEGIRAGLLRRSASYFGRGSTPAAN